MRVRQQVAQSISSLLYDKTISLVPQEASEPTASHLQLHCTKGKEIPKCINEQYIINTVALWSRVEFNPGM